MLVLSRKSKRVAKTTQKRTKQIQKEEKMKVVRVKTENFKKVLAAIPGATLTQAPHYDWNSGLSDDMTTPAVGMVGIQLPDGMSGKQAHKIIQAAIA